MKGDYPNGVNEEIQQSWANCQKATKGIRAPKPLALNTGSGHREV